MLTINSKKSFPTVYHLDNTNGARKKKAAKDMIK